MTPVETLVQLEGYGARLRLVPAPYGPELQICLPADVHLPAEFEAELRANREGIIDLLQTLQPGCTSFPRREGESMVEWLDRMRWTEDPLLACGEVRPDWELWNRLLAHAYDLDGYEPSGLFASLHGLRCLGARLETSANSAGAPSVRLTAGDIGDFYSVLRRKYLLPHEAALRRLLRDLAHPTP
jgi:hypothetical protein